jgi:hypothetical protein
MGDAAVRVQIIQAPFFSGVGVAASLTFSSSDVDLERLLKHIDAQEDLFRATEGRSALRDGLDLEGSLVAHLHWDEEKALSCWVVADALGRSAATVSDVVARVIRDELW